MVRIYCPDVAVPTVDAAARFPLIDDPLEPESRAPEVMRRAKPSATLSLPVQGLGAVRGVSPSPLVSSSCALASCGRLPRGRLTPSASTSAAAVFTRVHVETGC